MSTVEDLAKRSVVLKGFSDLLAAEVVNQFIFDRTGGFPHDVCSLEHLSWPDGGIRWLALLQSDIDQQEILKQPTSVIKYRDQEYRVSVDVPSVCIVPEHWTHHSHQMADNKETINDPSTGNVIDPPESDLPSDGAISGTRELHTDDDMQGQPQPQGGHGQMGGQIKTGLGISGQTSQQPQQTGQLPYGFQYPAGHQNTDPQPQPNYPATQGRYQYPYPHQGQDNPEQFYQPYFDTNYNCWITYDQHGRILFLHHSQDPSFYHQQHGTPNRPVQGNTDTGVPGRSREDHPGQHGQGQQFPAHNPPPNQGYPQPSYHVPEGAAHHGPPYPTSQANVKLGQGTAPSYQNDPHDLPPSYDESMLLPDSPSDQRMFVQDQYAQEKKYAIKNAVSVPYDSSNRSPVPSYTEREHPKTESEVKGLDGSKADSMEEPAQEANVTHQDEENIVQIIEVKGLPQDVTEDTVSLYFENKRRSGGGTVEKIELKGDGRALVCFEDKNVAQRVAEKAPHMIGKHALDVSLYIPMIPEPEKEEETLPPDTITVRGCGSVTDETLTMYFENKRSGGGDVKEVRRGSDPDVVYITFENHEVSHRVVEKDLHTVGNNRLEVSLYFPEKPEPVMQEETLPPDTITVRGCGSVTDETLTMYFENKRSGGGDVKEVRRGSDPDVVYITFENHEDETLTMYFENKRNGGDDIKKVRRGSDSDVVYITFENHEVSHRVVEKDLHTVENNRLEVSLYFPEKPEPVMQEETLPPDTITVRGCGSVTDETLTMYFENKRSGGGDVKEVRRGSDPDVVYITFENHEVVEAVCNKPQKIEGNSLQVEPFTKSLPRSSHNKTNTNRRKEQFHGSCYSDEDEEDDGDDSAYVLEVKGLTDNMSVDTLQLYFENRRRSGGGPVENLEIDRGTGTALVYFEEGNVVQRVVQKAPHLLEKKKLEVSEYCYSPNRSKGQGCQVSPLKGTAEGTVVEITGVVEGTSEETLLLYFENKRRSGGTNVKEIITVESEEETMKYIVYETKEEANTVASKQHTVDGHKLKARLYRSPTPPPPQPKYPDRFLISGLKETTCRDALMQFMQKKLGCEPKDLVYGEEPGTVLVSVIDQRILSKLRKMKRVCKKRPLEGAFLELSDVSISSSILVRGLAENTSEDTLTLYFESKKSGNAMEVDVENVEMIEDTNHALVYFKNHEVISRILKKTHSLDGVSLQVSLYTECLGVGGGHKDPSWFSVPPPLTLDNLDPYKLKFIKNSKTNLKNLEEQLDDGFSILRWDSEESVILECSLTKSVPGAREKAKAWKKEAEDDFSHFLNLLISEKINVLQEVWSDVMTKIGGLKMPRPDAATIYAFDESQLIVVVGHKTATEGLIKQAKETVLAVENDHERKKKEIIETVNNLKPWQLHFLSVTGFHSDMMKKYPTLKVQIHPNKNEITFVGLMSDVKNVKIDMYESINVIKETTLTSLSDAQIKLLTKKDVRHYIVKKLKQKNIVGVWEADNEKLKVYACSDLEVTNVAHILKQSVCEQVIDLDPESVPLLKSPKWIAVYDEQTKGQGETVKIMPAADRSRIVIAAIDELIAAVAEAVNNFIRDNTVYSDTIRFQKGIQRFMIKHMDADVQEIASKFQSYSAEITFQKASPEFTVKATKDGMSIITSELVKLSQNILVMNHVFSKPGIAKLIRSEKGDQHISNIENVERCIIEKHYNEQEQVVYGNKKKQRAMRTVTGGPTIQATCDLGSGHTLYVSQGDITQMKVDAIVNAANQQLAHIGGLARAIVDRGGHDIQAESDKIRSSQGDIDVGQVAVTGPGRLSCKIVIHAVGPIWGGGKRGEEDLLQEAIFNSLEKADSCQLSSIAIPALSTGIYKYPVAEATKAIVEAVHIHFQNNPTSQVQEVYVCDNNMNTVQEFVNAVNQKFGKSNVASNRTGSRNQSYSAEPVRDSSNLSHRQQLRKRGSSHQDSTPRRRGRASDSKINISIVTSEIAKEQVDVIVNTTSNGLDLTNGAVSKSLLKAGGQRIQEECKRDYPNGIKSGTFAVSSGGNLQCQYIFHACLPSWSNTANEQILENLVEACLQEASQKRCTSLAFPALGTGNLGYPKDTVAKTMVETIEQFSRSNHSSSVNEVKIVLYHKDTDTIKAFQDCQGNAASSGDGHGKTRSRRNRKFAKDGASSGYRQSDDEEWEHITSSDLSGVFTLGEVELTVKQGDLTKEKVDCIVNSTNTDLDLRKGAVSQSLVKAGGEDLIAEVQLKKSDMKKNGVAITTAKGLAAKYIVHVSADFFNEDWKKMISKSLKEAGKTVYPSSIAFPALGTGQYNINPENMAKILIDALNDYQKSASSSGFIPDVRMVIYQKDMLEPFITGIHKAASASRGGKSVWRKAYDWWNKDDKDRDDGRQQQKSRPAEADTEVSLHFFSDNQMCIQQAIDRLNLHYKDHVMEKVISEDVLKGLRGKWKDEIEDLKSFGIQVDYNHRLGRVRLQGLTTDVVQAMDAVHKIILSAQRQEQESQNAEMLSSYVQWSFIDFDKMGNEKHVEYDKISNRIIESAYKEGKSTVSIKTDENDTYIIDFNKMVEYPSFDITDTLDVVRKDLIKGTTFEAPSKWSTMSSESEMIIVPPGNKEYNDVQQQFLASLGRTATIVKIERVQTKFLWQQYVAKKQQLDKQNPGHKNETILWHGTSADAIPSIYKGGFNRSYCGKNATALGMGVYFAVNTSYSASHTYSVPDQQGHKHMFMARVLTGMITRGKSGMRVPPVRDASQHILFDSVVDNPAAPGMYIIFNDTQAYPDYLITFI